MTNSTASTTPTIHPIIAECRLHYAQHIYRRGQYKGDAPVGARWKSHFRLIDKGTDGFVVRFHNTDILTVSMDGTVRVYTGGWEASPTTRDAVETAFYELTPYRGTYMRSRRAHNISQTMFRLPGRTAVVFYEGLTVTSDGTLATPLSGRFPPILKRIKDRDETREFLNDPDVRAFREVLPILHSALGDGPTVDQRLAARQSYYTNQRHLDLWCARPEDWPHIVAHYYRGTYRATWSAYYADATKKMTKIVEVE